ncbi:CMRF35-like molecule 7 [Betta splendens]|uniref:CMRF35-like molecule 7 n=1 Tax=Betta splendens TaxID=158456 RepID=A0A6P7M162_BETSP|nr:CMRF35-like molecule 7 [Betta splendens]
MELTFLILVFFVKELWETEAVSVTGEVEDEVTVTCSHSNAFYNIKYFCKGDCGNEKDVLISTREKSSSDGKYSIRDEGNTFYVTIHRLTMDDSGIYWCGIERYGVDTYNEVVLEVKEGNKNNAGQANATSSEWLVSVRTAVGLAVLFLVMTVLLALARRGRRHIQSCSGKDHDTNRSSQKQVHAFTASTAKEDEDADDRCKTNRGHTDNVYANVTASSAVPIRPEGLLYSTVSFGTHTACSPATPPPAVIYSTITH